MLGFSFLFVHSQHGLPVQGAPFVLEDPESWPQISKQLAEGCQVILPREPNMA